MLYFAHLRSIWPCCCLFLVVEFCPLNSCSQSLRIDAQASRAGGVVAVAACGLFKGYEGGEKASSAGFLAHLFMFRCHVLIALLFLAALCCTTVATKLPATFLMAPVCTRHDFEHGALLLLSRMTVDACAYTYLWVPSSLGWQSEEVVKEASKHAIIDVVVPPFGLIVSRGE